jgi:hypothetical protein
MREAIQFSLARSPVMPPLRIATNRRRGFSYPPPRAEAASGSLNHNPSKSSATRVRAHKVLLSYLT